MITEHTHPATLDWVSRALADEVHDEEASSIIPRRKPPNTERCHKLGSPR